MPRLDGDEWFESSIVFVVAWVDRSDGYRDDLMIGLDCGCLGRSMEGGDGGIREFGSNVRNASNVEPALLSVTSSACLDFEWGLKKTRINIFFISRSKFIVPEINGR